MGSNIIQIESLSLMSFDDVLSLYRQGYRLEERSVGTRSLDIKSLTTCPGTVPTGSTLTLSASASAGTPPYHYVWKVTKPGGVIETLTDQASNSYTFTTDGNYGISVYVTDTCLDGTGTKTSPVQMCSVVASTSTTIPAKYNCSGAPSYSCSGPFVTGTYEDRQVCLDVCKAGVVTDPCLVCDKTLNYCVGGQCIKKKYALYGGVATGVLVVLMLLKK